MKDYLSPFICPFISDRDSDIKGDWSENLFNWSRPPRLWVCDFLH